MLITLEISNSRQFALNLHLRAQQKPENKDTQRWSKELGE